MEEYPKTLRVLTKASGKGDTENTRCWGRCRQAHTPLKPIPPLTAAPEHQPVAKGSRKNNFTFCCRLPGPRIFEMTSVLNNKRFSYLNAINQRRSLGAAALRVAAAGGHLRRCHSSTMSPHRLRRGAWHLPARRSRQNVNLFLREPLGYCIENT